jgi:phage-related protein
MNEWKIIYYENDKNVSEIYNYIESLSIKNQAKVLNWIEMLSKKGLNLTRPYSDLIEEGIHELRIKLSGNQIRVLYFFCYKDYIILTHSFTKNTQKVPISEINKSKKCRIDFLNRYTEKIIKEKYNENI